MTQLNVWLQTVGGPAADRLFLFLTHIAHPITIALAAIVLYWCYRKEYGVSIVLAVTTSVGFNTILKLIMQIPRPYTYDPRIRRLDIHTSPGSSFPSSHAQSIASFLTDVCLSVRRIWMTAVTVVICAVVALSRLYLGVHTILDVTVGLAIGVLWAWLVFWSSQKILTSGRRALLLAYPAALLLLLLVFQNDDLCKMGSICLGFVAGYLLDERFVGFSPSRYIRVKIADAVLGLTAVGAVKLVTMLTFPDTLPFTLLEYCLTGLVVSFVCPYCFSRINHKLSPRK